MILGKFKSAGCTTIEKFSAANHETLTKWNIPNDMGAEMGRLINAGAPNFNNHETYSYFCVMVLPNIFEKLRTEKRLQKVENKEVEFKGDVRLYTGECFEGEPAGIGTSVGKGLGPCTGTGFGSEGDIGIMMTKPKSKIVSKPKFSGSWFNQLPHGLVTIEFPDT